MRFPQSPFARGASKKSTNTSLMAVSESGLNAQADARRESWFCRHETNVITVNGCWPDCRCEPRTRIDAWHETEHMMSPPACRRSAPARPLPHTATTHNPTRKPTMSTTIPDSIHPSDLPEIGQPLADGTFFARQWLNGNGSAPSQSPVRLRHIPTLPLFARLRPGFFRAFPHADVSPAAESALAPRPGALSQRTES